jgi:hypothetical protein
MVHAALVEHSAAQVRPIATDPDQVALVEGRACKLGLSKTRTGEVAP